MDYTNFKEDPYIHEEFEKYKQTEIYKNYTETIKIDKPTLSPYLVEMCMFGFFYEELRNSMDDEQLQKYPSLLSEAEKTPYKKPEPIKEYKGVSVYESEAQYLKENPHVKPIKMDIENPFRPENSETNNVIE